MSELKELITIGKDYRDSLLDNLLTEQNFKIHLKSEGNKEKSVAVQFTNSIEQMRTMFGKFNTQLDTMHTNLKEDINAIQSQVTELSTKIN